MSEIRVTHREKDEGAIRSDRDKYGNLSYWVGISIDGEEQQKGCLVSHKGDRDIMQVGDTFEQHGFAGIESKKSKAGNEYFKAVRPQSAAGNGNGGGGGGRKSAEELAQDLANSSLIRAAEYYAIPPEQRPSIKDFAETTAKFHTLMSKLKTGTVTVDA